MTRNEYVAEMARQQTVQAAAEFIPAKVLHDLHLAINAVWHACDMDHGQAARIVRSAYESWFESP